MLRESKQTSKESSQFPFPQFPFPERGHPIGDVVVATHHATLVSCGLYDCSSLLHSYFFRRIVFCSRFQLMAKHGVLPFLTVAFGKRSQFA